MKQPSIAEQRAALGLDASAQRLKQFPIAAGAKYPPLVQSWPTVAKPRSEWVSAAPGCNWGVSCEGLLVVDVDTRNNGHKWSGLDALPETLTVRTPSGGEHRYFSLPDGHPGVANSASKIAFGVDIKSTGGYVVAPGSKIEGPVVGEYTIAKDAPIAEAPAWLIDLAGAARPKKETAPVLDDAGAYALGVAREWLSTQPVGDGAYATACGLRDRGLSLAQALELMAEHDPRPNVPEKVEHAYAYAQGEPGAKIATPEDFPAVPVEPRKITKGAPLSFAELVQGDVAGPDYLIKGVINRRSQAVVYGQPGVGKTFVALDMAFHVAAGMPWMGKRVRQAPVVYLAYEGIGGMKARAKALAQQYGRTDVPLWIVPASFDFTDKANREALAELIGLTGELPGLIVVDTLARAMAGRDENSAQDMGLLNASASALIDATGACVLFVHHAGKADNGARGSSALLGALDTEIKVSNGVIRATKQRDVELGDEIGFMLRPILVGTDSDGDDITSCVVMPAAKPVEVDGLKGDLGRAFHALCDLTGAQNNPVAEADWLAACTFTPQAKKRIYDWKRLLLKRGLIEHTPEGWQRKLQEPSPTN